MYTFDVDWDGLVIFPLDVAIKRNAQWWADTLPQMLAQLRQHFADDGIDEGELIIWFEEFKRKYCELRGQRLTPTPAGIRNIKSVYKQLAPYRNMVHTITYCQGPVKLMPELYRIYEVMFSIIDIYDNYCLDTDESQNQDPSENAAAIAAEGRDECEFMSDAGGTIAVDAEGNSKDAATFVSTTDFSHMRSFTPEIAFDMSALYSFLVDESVIINIDEKLFTDCISHAHINELWENADKRRMHNKMQSLFKMLAQDWYTRKWLSTCASNLNMTVKQISNPTRTGATDRFEKKLWAVLRGKNRD
jgi:hypothetical protein